MKKRLLFAAALSAVGTAGYFYAKNNPDKAKRMLYDVGNSAVFGLLGGIKNLTPKPQPSKENLVFEGTKSFLSSPAQNARWQLGYASHSVLPDNLFEQPRYIAGFLSYPPHRVDGVLDDQRLRVICLDDSSGRGKVVFGVLDCIGISQTDVSKIRESLATFASENNIVSLNISAIHCHSAIDTQGLWGDLKKAVFNNAKAIKQGKEEECISGREPEFMQHLCEVATRTIKEAVADLKPGRLYRTTTNALPYSCDSRPPEVMCKDITKLRFAPDDGSRETVCVFMAAHPVCVGFNNCSVSADYVYYIDEAIQANGANCVFFQGAQLGIKTNRGKLAELGFAQSGSYQDYGRAVGKFVYNLPRESETELAPLLNIVHKRIDVECTNPLLEIAGRLKIVNNAIKPNRNGSYCFSTEIGYAELGCDFSLALIPGELAPELLLGGTLPADKAYNHTEWDFAPMKNSVPDKYLTVIGLCNDSVGYILPENDFGSVIAPLHYEEAVSAGAKTAQTIVSAFNALVLSKTVDNYAVIL